MATAPSRLHLRDNLPAALIIFGAVAWSALVGLGGLVSPLVSAMLLAGPIGVWALMASPAVRLVSVVVGGLLVFGSSEGVGVLKIAYFALLLTCAVVSAVNLLADPPPWAQHFVPLVPLGVLLVVALVLATLAGPSVGMQTSVRQALFYLMLPIAPIVGIDAGRSIKPSTMHWFVGVLGILAAISYSIDWMGRRGVFQAPIAKFMASSFVVPAMAWSLAVVLLVSSRSAGRLLWLLPLVIIPIALLMPGTRTNLVVFAAPMAMIGSRATKRAPLRSLLLIAGVMIVALVTLLPLFAKLFISDPDFLASRIRLLTGVFGSGVTSDQSGAARVQQYDYAWAHTQTSPVFGLGPGYAADVVLDTPLTVLMRIGFFGTAVLLCFLGAIVFCSVRAARKIGGSEFATAACGIAVVVCCLIPFGTVIEDRGFAMMLAMLLAGVGSTLNQAHQANSLSAHKPGLSRSTMTPMNYFQALRRVWALVLACALVGAAVGASSMNAKSYTATAQIVVNVAGGDSPSDVNQGADYALRQMPTYVGMTRTAVVLGPVINKLGLSTTVDSLASHVSADTPLDTTIIVITVDDTDAQRSADIANAVAAQLAEVLREQSPSPSGDRVIAPKVLSPAVAPTTPSSPSRTLALTVGLLGGLAVGWLAALVLWARSRGRRASERALG